MKYFFLFLLFFVFVSCSNKPKSVLICGDHVCVNKNEAKQYFEKNLTLEVKILDKKKEKSIDLVELNLNSENNQKKISLKRKDDTLKKVKTLSPKEIKEIKSKVKNIDVQKELNKSKDIKQVKVYEDIKRIDNKKKIVVEDVCLIIKKCNIDEISKYLINEGKNKKFPDITKRQ
tara:strand:- start:1431 stop:1952 length:522 start_codon:yes stop_codon:yes gene_type:complete